MRELMLLFSLLVQQEHHLLDMAIDAISIDECVAYGCTDPLAPNYDPAATADDGSCILL